MMKVFMANGGDINKPGPPGYPVPDYLLWRFTDRQDTLGKDNVGRRKIIQFLVSAGADVNVSNTEGISKSDILTLFSSFVECCQKW
jgi:hypothetical protein